MDRKSSKSTLADYIIEQRNQMSNTPKSPDELSNDSGIVNELNNIGQPVNPTEVSNNEIKEVIRDEYGREAVTDAGSGNSRPIDDVPEDSYLQENNDEYQENYNNIPEAAKYVPEETRYNQEETTYTPEEAHDTPEETKYYEEEINYIPEGANSITEESKYTEDEVKYIPAYTDDTEEEAIYTEEEITMFMGGNNHSEEEIEYTEDESKIIPGDINDNQENNNETPREYNSTLEEGNDASENNWNNLEENENNNQQKITSEENEENFDNYRNVSQSIPEENEASPAQRTLGSATNLNLYQPLPSIGRSRPQTPSIPGSGNSCCKNCKQVNERIAIVMGRLSDVVTRLDEGVSRDLAHYEDLARTCPCRLHVSKQEPEPLSKKDMLLMKEEQTPIEQNQDEENINKEEDETVENKGDQGEEENIEEKENQNEDVKLEEKEEEKLQENEEEKFEEKEDVKLEENEEEKLEENEEVKLEENEEVKLEEKEEEKEEKLEETVKEKEAEIVETTVEETAEESNVENDDKGENEIEKLDHQEQIETREKIQDSNNILLMASPAPPVAAEAKVEEKKPEPKPVEADKKPAEAKKPQEPAKTTDESKKENTEPNKKDSKPKSNVTSPTGKDSPTPQANGEAAKGGKPLRDQFRAFSKFGDTKSDGKQLTLSQSDKWMKQAQVIDRKTITTTDTAIHFKKFKQMKLGFQEYETYLESLAKAKKTDLGKMKSKMIECGPPAAKGTTSVVRNQAVDRLTDTSKYTGSHKLRFDETGKGKGAEGRRDPANPSGYVRGYKNKDTYDKSH